MRHWRTFVAALIALGCGDRTPPAAIVGSAALHASVQSELAPPLVFNAQMRSELEVPTCVSESQGHAQIKILQDGTIQAAARINNLGGETIRFGQSFTWTRRGSAVAVTDHGTNASAPEPATHEEQEEMPKAAPKGDTVAGDPCQRDHACD